MRVPLHSAASTTSTPADTPLMIRLRIGKFCGGGGTAIENSVKDAAHIVFGTIRKVMSRLKISAISYLNTAPLMWDFERGEAGAGNNFDISYTLPPACAEALRKGAADICIIPAAAYTTVPDFVIIPDVAIAARRAVSSILLV